MDFVQSFRLAAPEVLFSLSGLVLLLGAAWSRGDAGARILTWLSVAVLAVAAVLTAPTLFSGAKGAETVAFSGLFAATAFAAFAKLLIFAAAGASLVVAPAFFQRVGAYRPEYPVLVLFAVLGMCLMVSATNLLTLYIGLELNSLAAYVFAAFLRTDDRSAEAGLKYFVLGSLASGILLFGTSLTYGFAGTIDFAGIAAALNGKISTGAIFGLVFVFAGLAFKISAVPFHMWTPDVYEGAPTPVTTFFASAPKVAALALTVIVAMTAFGHQAAAWQPIVIFAALASI
ncbi:MAG: NADH-quinone oxidoreductase subunit NuoN, partial [Pseudomonadota bacterium]